MNVVIPTFALSQKYKSFGQLQLLVELIVLLLDYSHNSQVIPCWESLVELIAQAGRFHVIDVLLATPLRLPLVTQVRVVYYSWRCLDGVQ